MSSIDFTQICNVLLLEVKNGDNIYFVSVNFMYLHKIEVEQLTGVTS